jgi:endoglucanase
MEYIEALRELNSYPGVSGHEKMLASHVVKLFEEYCDVVRMDEFYNVVGLIKGTSGEKKRVMLCAHMDEIGLLVTKIDEKGFVKFSNIGGLDAKILPAQEVIIHGRKDIKGIIGAKPPHLLKPDEMKKAVKIEEMSIDTGLSSEEAKEIISVGDIIAFKDESLVLLNNKYSSKSLDNRAGVAALLDIMQNLKGLRHECDVYFTATVQEEVGLRGAKIASYNIYPDIAVVIDACHGDVPYAPKDETYGLGKGPAIAVGPNLHKRYTKRMIELAKEENILYQIDTEPGNTGTEAWAIQVARSGVPTVLVSIPLRYMHTTIETIDVNDIKYTGRLVSRFISTIENETEET